MTTEPWKSPSECSSDDETGLQEMTSLASTASGPAGDDETGVIVKIGHTINNFVGEQSLARLSDILNMQANQVRSIGSAHSKNGPCEACSFHFTHIRMPTR